MEFSTFSFRCHGISTNRFSFSSTKSYFFPYSKLLAFYFLLPRHIHLDGGNYLEQFYFVLNTRHTNDFLEMLCATLNCCVFLSAYTVFAARRARCHHSIAMRFKFCRCVNAIRSFNNFFWWLVILEIFDKTSQRNQYVRIEIESKSKTNGDWHRLHIRHY